MCKLDSSLFCATLKIPVWLWETTDINQIKKLKYQMYNFSFYKENVQIRFPPFL